MFIRKKKLKEFLAERYDQGLQVGFSLACTYYSSLFSGDTIPPSIKSLYENELISLSPLMQEIELIVKAHVKGH